MRGVSEPTLGFWRASQVGSPSQGPQAVRDSGDSSQERGPKTTALGSLVK